MRLASVMSSDEDSMRTSTNTILRLVAVFLAICIAGDMANEYLELGWFGHRGKLIGDILIIVGCIFFMIAPRMWRRN